MDDASETSIQESRSTVSSAASSREKKSTAISKPPGGSGSHLSGLSNPPGGIDGGSKESGGSRSPSNGGIGVPPGGSGSVISLASKMSEESGTRAFGGLARPTGGSGSQLSKDEAQKPPPGGSGSVISLGSKTSHGSGTNVFDGLARPPGGSGSHLSKDELQKAPPGGSGSVISLARSGSQLSKDGAQNADIAKAVDDVVDLELPGGADESLRSNLSQSSVVAAITGEGKAKDESASAIAGSGPSEANVEKKNKTVAALMKGLRSGAVAKIVDKMEETAEVPQTTPVEQPPNVVQSDPVEEWAAAQQVIETNPSKSLESSNQSDDVLDDGYFEQQAEAMKLRGARAAVMAETWQPTLGWKPKVVAKTKAQRSQIQSVCASSWLFSSLTVESLDQVIDAFEGPMTVNEGDEVIREGQSVSSDEPGLFIFESGKLGIFKSREGAAYPGIQVFAVSHCGHSFGEVALLYNCPRTATVVAIEKSVLWYIDRNTFNHCVKGAMMERRERHIKFLKSVELLRDLTSNELDTIAEVMYSRTFRTGDEIIKFGDVGHEFFILEKGSAFSSIQGCVVKEYTPGDYFGELAMIARQPRAADVFASSTPTVVAVLDAESFERLLGKLTDLMAERSKFYSTEGTLPAYRTSGTEVLDVLYEEEVNELEGDNEGLEEMAEEEFVRKDQVIENRATPSWKPPQYQKTDAQFKAILLAISSSVIFHSLHPEDLFRIAHAFKGPTKVVPGAGIIQEGHRVGLYEPGLFLLETGSLKVYKRNKEKRKVFAAARGDVVGAIDKSWSLFGEVALLQNCPRTATVVATIESVLWSIDCDTFQNCVILAKRHRKEARLKFLENLEIFRGLTSDERLRLCEVLQTRHYSAGDTIISQGDIGTDFFLLEEGSAHAEMDGSLMREYGPCDFFGELALIHEQPRIASVVADKTPTVCAVLDAGRFKGLLGNFLDIMQQRQLEYKASPRSFQIDDQDDEVESEMDEAEFQRQEAITRAHRLRGRRAIVSEHWIPQQESTAVFYPKTQIQYDLIQNTCLQSFLFENLASENLTQIVNAFKGPSRVASGTQIALQGTRVYGKDPALYVIEKGSLDVFKAGEGESRPGQFVCTLDRVGSAFGELHLVEICARPVTVRVRSDCVLWSIDRETYNNLVKGYNLGLRRRQEHFLASVDIFRNLSAEQRGKLVDVIELKTYVRGQYIIRKGDLGTSFFVLQEGSAIAMIHGQRVREYGPSQYFGELALMYRQPRAADILASASPTTVAVLTSGAFARILGNLQTLMAERATEYSSHRLGVASWIVPTRDAGPEWICNASRCNFRNFGRMHVCFKCGQPRPIGNQSEAIVPFQALQVQLATKARPDLLGPVPVVVHALELSGAQEGRTNVIFATYPRRITDVGLVQGTYPMVPGESFQVTINSLGTFGEISVGLAPSAKVSSAGEKLEWLRKRHSSGLAKDFRVGPAEPAEPRGASMVGWGVREIGFTGDHGMWCFRGRVPGPKVSEPWQQGDVVECGIDQSGGLYMKRNGERVDTHRTGPLGTDEYWPAEDSYPTVTFHSSGAEILLNLSNITRKPEPRAAYDLPPADAAKNLLNALRRTFIPGAYSSSFWSWCNCSDVQIRRPEATFHVASSSAEPGRSGVSSPKSSPRS